MHDREVLLRCGKAAAIAAAARTQGKSDPTVHNVHISFLWPVPSNLLLFGADAEDESAKGKQQQTKSSGKNVRRYSNYIVVRNFVKSQAEFESHLKRLTVVWFISSGHVNLTGIRNFEEVRDAVRAFNDAFDARVRQQSVWFNNSTATGSLLAVEVQADMGLFTSRWTPENMGLDAIIPSAWKLYTFLPRFDLISLQAHIQERCQQMPVLMGETVLLMTVDIYPRSFPTLSQQFKRKRRRGNVKDKDKTRSFRRINRCTVLIFANGNYFIIGARSREQVDDTFHELCRLTHEFFQQIDRQRAVEAEEEKEKEKEKEKKVKEKEEEEREKTAVGRKRSAHENEVSFKIKKAKQLTPSEAINQYMASSPR